ncbi:unnamed protein product [Prunus armeniaca]
MILLVVYWIAAAASKLLPWMCGLCNLMVNFDPHLDQLSMINVGGLLPQIHALQIALIGSSGPSSSKDGGGRSGDGGVCAWNWPIVFFFG